MAESFFHEIKVELIHKWNFYQIAVSMLSAKMNPLGPFHLVQQMNNATKELEPSNKRKNMRLLRPMRI